MKPSLVIRSLTAAAALFAGAAVAGPSNPAAFATPVHRSAARGCPSQQAVTRDLGLVNAKTNTPTRASVGTKFVGCTGASISTVTCKGSGVSCSEMIRG